MPKIFQLSTGSQRYGLDSLSSAASAHDADCEIDAVPAAGAAKQILDIFHRIHVVFSDALNHETTFDPSLVRRAIWFDRADQHAASRLITERVGQFLV